MDVVIAISLTLVFCAFLVAVLGGLISRESISEACDRRCAVCGVPEPEHSTGDGLDICRGCLERLRPLLCEGCVDMEETIRPEGYPDCGKLRPFPWTGKQ